jgi:hypothetical protein
MIIFLSVLTSCVKLDISENEDKVTAEGNIIDIVTKSSIGHAVVKILEWHEGFLWGGPYSVEKDSCYTDSNGHFVLSDDANKKYTYTLCVSGDKYFKDEGYPLSLSFLTKVNISLFPHGFIKTHITNKIDTAKFIEILVAPTYSSQEIFREGFINTSLMVPAFADSTIITKTIGGLMNQMRILIYSDYVPDAKVIIDTSFFTIRHDTLHLDKIIQIR